MHILIPTTIHLLFNFGSHQWRFSYIYKLVSSALVSPFKVLLSFDPITTLICESLPRLQILIMGTTAVKVELGEEKHAQVW